MNMRKRAMSLLCSLVLLCGLSGLTASAAISQEEEAKIKDRIVRYVVHRNSFESLYMMQPGVPSPSNAPIPLKLSKTIEGLFFDGKITEENLDAVWYMAWSTLGDYSPYAVRELDYYAEEWEAYAAVIPLTEAKRIMEAAFDCAVSVDLKKLSCFNSSMNTLVVYIRPSGGPIPFGGKADITQNAKGNWEIYYEPGTEVIAQLKEDKRLYIELTSDMKIRRFEPKLVAESLQMLHMPSKLEYKQGESLDLSGSVLRAQYDIGLTQDIPVNASMISGYDKNKIGAQTLTVSHGGKTVTFQVTVKQTIATTPPATTSSATTSQPTASQGPASTSPVDSTTPSSAPTPTESGSLPSLVDTGTNIAVMGAIPEHAALSVQPIAENEEAYTTIKEKLPEAVSRFQSYDISLLDTQNIKVQPDGQVQISIPKPQGFGNNLAVYRTETDQSMTRLDSEVKDGKVVFTTDHFSLYTIAELADTPVIAPPAETPKGGMPIGGIVAIVIGALVVVAGGVTAGIFLYRKKKAAV